MPHSSPAGAASTLQFTELTLPTAHFGPPNLLPPLGDAPAQPYAPPMDDVPDEIRRNAAYGHLDTVYPYLPQDGYDRQREPRTHQAVVLDNGQLRAVFLPELGGRLWSLTDLTTGRELLFRNPVVQPANLALRNAWVAGGVEWNIGTRGHAPTTCAPLFAAEAAGPEQARHGGGAGGSVPALRMWEYERLRGAVFQIDAWLPEDTAELKVRVSVRNPTEQPAPLYWWSNIAVPERPGMRVLAPARRAFATTYDGRLATVPTPGDDPDYTYPDRSRWAGDWFFDIPDDAHPWIAAVDPDGTGLLHSSTPRLQGRKLFVWGQNAGGRRWAEWLTAPESGAYVEIQAGLARTQFEHLPLGPGAEWTWTETYQPLQVAPDVIQQASWSRACAAVETHLSRDSTRIPAQRPAADEPAADGGDAWARRAPTRLLTRGSGWGALESRRRRAAGQTALDTAAAPFPEESLDDEQHPWLALLEHGTLPEPDPQHPPQSYVAGSAWAHLLAEAPQSWLSAYHLAVLAHARGETATAHAWYTTSLDVVETPWARRGLGLLLSARGESAAAAGMLVTAATQASQVWQAAAEAAEVLLRAGQPAECRAFLDRCPEPVQARGRIQLLLARAAVQAGEPDRCRAILDAGLTVEDLREGETSYAELWRAVYPNRPLPARYDFRMSDDDARQS